MIDNALNTAVFCCALLLTTFFCLFVCCICLLGCIMIKIQDFISVFIMEFGFYDQCILLMECARLLFCCCNIWLSEKATISE